MAELEITLIPLLTDNYAYLLHDPESGVTGVVDTPVRSGSGLASFSTTKD